MSDPALLAGAATVDITPDRELPNYAGVVCWPEQSASRLQAQAVVISDRTTTVALVVCDVTKVDRSMILRIRDTCTRRTGLSAGHVIVAATHTHHAPATADGFVAGAKPDPLYLDVLEDRTSEALATAMQQLAPVVLVSGSTASPGFELNRRSVRPDGGIAFQQWRPEWPSEGPTDPTLSFLGFESATGEPLAIITSYACHNVTSNPFESRGYSADLFGYTSATLRDLYPTLKAAPILAGAQGNLVFGDPQARVLHHSDEFARNGGKECAKAVSSAFRSAPRTSAAHIELARHEVEFLDRPLEESTFCEDGCRGTTSEDLEFARKRYEPERAAVEGRGRTTYPVELTGVAIGDAALIMNPGELFVELGLQIREESPFATTLVASMANGDCGYIPTTEAFNRGGYETHRTVYTSRLAPGSGEEIVRLSRDLLRRLNNAGSSKSESIAGSDHGPA